MERVFSRRSFLKYTAVAAVAVAGTSLLTGCEHGDNPVQTEIGTTNKVLKVSSSLDKVTREGTALTFDFTIYNGRTNAIQVDTSSFAVNSSNGFYAYKNGKLAVISKQPEDTEDVTYVVGPQVKKGETMVCSVKVFNFPEMQSTDTVTLTFFPDTEYTEYSANWKLSADAIDSTEE